MHGTDGTGAQAIWDGGSDDGWASQRRKVTSVRRAASTTSSVMTDRPLILGCQPPEGIAQFAACCRGMFNRASSKVRCLVPKSRDASLTPEMEEALWQAVFMVQPGQRREFEPSSKRRKKRAVSWPGATG